MRLLVAENDPALATFLQEGFDHEHYAVDLTCDGDDAKYWIERRHYDLAILDLDMERGRGTQVLQFVRANRSQLPILVLSSQSRAEEYARVLDLGADDLILKPFLFPELAAKVRAVLRRVAGSAETVLWLDDLQLNCVEHSVKRAGREIELTPKEFGLLECLMRNAGKHVTRAQILNQVWKLPNGTLTNVVDVYVNYLRSKINGPLDRKLIHTVRGIGYQMNTVADRAGPQFVESKE